MASLPSPSAGARSAALFETCGDGDVLGFGLMGANAARAASARDAALTQIVQSEIIPRLMMAHGPARLELREGGRLHPNAAIEIDEDEIEAFARRAIMEGHGSLLAAVGDRLRRGANLEDIYLNLLGPAARLLGEFWRNDTASYADVTIALGRLQQVVRELSQHGPRSANNPSTRARSAFFAPCPGEQHTFGLLIVEEFFRNAGWRTWSDPMAGADALSATVATHWFDVFGMTVSCMERLDHVAPIIMSVRRASQNRDICVMVGGRLFIERPELADEIGADICAADAAEAVLRAEGAVRLALTRP